MMIATSLCWALATAQLRQLRDPATFAALFHVPSNVDGPLPLLLYLHGAGESGSDIRGLISEGATGTPPVELEHGTALPILARRFVVVAPQTDHGWVASEIGAFLDFLLSRADLNIDSKRCFVTGHSMGGAGALSAATLGRFAAAVPIAPAGSPPAPSLLGTPVWAFHGRNDVICPSSTSEELVRELQALGVNGSDAKLTLYDHAPAPKGWPDYDGHGSPMPAYANPALFRWLLDRGRRPG